MSKILNALKEASEIQHGFSYAATPGQSTTLAHSLVSQIGMAMKKLIETKKDSFLSASNVFEKEYRSEKQSFNWQSLLLAIVMVLSVASLILSVKTFSQMKAANYTAVVLTKDAILQKQKFGDFEKSLSQLRKDSDLQIERLSKDMTTLKAALQQREAKIAELTTANNKLTTTVEDFKWTAKNLTDKIVTITTQLDSVLGHQ